MTRARGTGERTAARFRDLVHNRLLPGLSVLGFGDRLPGSLAVAEAEGVVWLLDLEVAPWSTEQKVCFTVAWGAHVPGVEEAVGDPAPDVPTIATALVAGRVGQRDDALDPRWFELRALPRALAVVADVSLANNVLGAVASEVLPVLRQLSTPVQVQKRLHAGLVTGAGVPSAAELRTIRRIAALSMLLSDRGNAALWLDHLEIRSAAAMAPDVVAERLAPIRERLAS